MIRNESGGNAVVVALVVREALARLAGWHEESPLALAYRLIVQGLMKQQDALPEEMREELREEWSRVWDDFAHRRAR